MWLCQNITYIFPKPRIFFFLDFFFNLNPSVGVRDPHFHISYQVEKLTQNRLWEAPPKCFSDPEHMRASIVNSPHGGWPLVSYWGRVGVATNSALDWETGNVCEKTSEIERLSKVWPDIFPKDDGEIWGNHLECGTEEARKGDLNQLGEAWGPEQAGPVMSSQIPRGETRANEMRP